MISIFYISKSFKKNLAKNLVDKFLGMYFQVHVTRYISQNIFFVKSFEIWFQIWLKNYFGVIVDKKAERLHVSTTTTAIWWELPPMIYSLHFFSSEIKNKTCLGLSKKTLLPSLSFISFYGSVSVRQLLGISTTNQFTLLKFIYSEKATKFCKISTNYLTGST